MRLPHLPPLSLYVHLPWCLRKCPYCDFNSHELRGDLPETAYVDALLADLASAVPAAQGRALQSVFIGGGTPSLFSAGAIARLLAGIRARIDIAPGAEITLEANPGAAEAERFAGYRAAGVTRLSVGVQSFDGARLRVLGRVHDEHEARRAAALALGHFERVNLDLMYALPGQDQALAVADVRAALATGAGHLSCYQLTLEPNTVFGARPPAGLPGDDAAAAIEAAVHAELAAAGLRRYEVSAWSRPGEECRHNLNYWWFGDYLGIGAGAHAKISCADRIVREVRTRAPADYLRRAQAGETVTERREIAAAERVFEFLMNALRLPGGFPEKLLAERTGVTLAAAEPGLSTAIDRGLIERRAGEIRPTSLGLRFLNDLLALFLPDA
ncbi:MAG: oxygen-independent coproporphyrinogen III oxidase-like protein [Gammaproteobacteria bacterium]|nr:oxygen-independent coproporphyrinogen III oxidase-like protein [Gammaproteobacteria bacterium]